jgi:acyl-homoserine lactone acylase PvdQ
MPKKIRTGPLIFFLFSTAVFLLLLCSYRMVTQSLPVTRGRLYIAGLQGEVRVCRDGYGLPHVFAKNENDIFFAQGFVTAQDRLWQMDFLRHAAQGRLSEWFGPQASRTDSLMRGSGIRSSAERQWFGMPNESRVILERYASGVNAFIALNKNRLPFEYKMLSQNPGPWKPEDSISLFKWMAWQSDVRWLADPFLAELILRTDPMRMQNLLSPEEIRRILSSGTDQLSLAGLQGMASLQDATKQNAFLRRVFDEKWIRPPVSGNLAWTVSPSRSATGKPLLCVILRSALTSPSPWYEIRLSAGFYGGQGFSLPGFPMILAGHNGGMAWAWTGGTDDGPDRAGDQNNGGDEVLAFYRLGAAKNRNGFPDHLICADTSGRITPHGAVFNAGGGIGAQPQTGRLKTLMDRKARLNLEDVKQIQSDVVSDAAAALVASIRSILAKDTSGNPIKKQLRESLFQWNGSMQSGSAEAAFFETLALECLDRIYRDEMGDSLFASFKSLPSLHLRFLLKTLDDPLSPWWDDVRTRDTTETAAGVLKQSFEKSAEKLTALWGENISKWSWAGLHTLTFHHPLEASPLVGTLFRQGPFAVGGCATTLFSSDVDASSPFQTAAGVSAKMVLDLSGWGNSVSVLPPGQSGQLMDSHQQDQVQLYLQNYYHPMLWDSLKVEEAGMELMELLPEAARERR